jgi:SAM-dependent methyltransferase
LLHVGCGGETAPPWLLRSSEVRLDLNPDHKPDIVASMTDMGDIGTYDVVYSCHSLEHLKPTDVGLALSEFLRVLNPGGKVLIIVPDLEGVKPTSEPLFEAGCGVICGLDLFYGAHALRYIPYMEHKCGFVSETIKEALELTGFVGVIAQRLERYNLMAVGVKPLG